MKSIYQRALGEEFDRLHPKLRERYSLTSEADMACLGRGTMETVRQHTSLLRAGLRLSARRNLLFPEGGEGVPFTIRNYAYEDGSGRETVAWIREFHFPTPRRFDASMVYIDERQGIVDYLGTHQRLATDLSFTVEDDGSLRIRSHSPRVCAGREVSLPRTFAALADVRERYDETDECFRIDVTVRNPVVGPILSYRGSFTVEWHPCEDVPWPYRPAREARRE